MSRRKLPIFVDQAVGALKAEVIARGSAFERMVRKETTLSCRPGCDACCYYPIEISLLEAIPIYRALTEKGRWTPSFVKSLKEHADKTAFLSASIWMMSRIPCPLLADRRCSIYESRPLHCRTMWAKGDPYYCNGQNFGPQTTLVPKDEVMLDFFKYEDLIAQSVQLTNYKLPIGRAILLAEQIVTGQLSLHDVLTEMATTF